MQRYRLTPRVLAYLDGSSIRQRGPQPDPGADALRAALDAHARRLADGSESVLLADADALRLRLYIEGMEAGGRDNAWDPDGLADLNAARALLRRLPRR